MISETEMADYFETFTSSAFRLETLDAYQVHEEAEYLERFLAGEELPEEWRENPWVRSITQNGRSLQRVHVLTSPLSDYLRFQLGWGYLGNVGEGEDIRILDLADVQVSGLPDHDFWLFDETDVLRMHYSSAGEFHGAELLSRDRVDEYVEYRDLALGSAVPYTEYWSRYRNRDE